MEKLDLIEFYKNKKVFITGHTGFKGTWMSQILLSMGAEVCGYSVGIPTSPSLFEILGLSDSMYSVKGDVREYENLRKTLNDFKPDIVFHMAAQSLVLESYQNPVYTYETNVMGTVNLLNAARECESIISIVNITTDKVYRNNEWCWGYREDDILDGYDPYSNSKSCSELVTSTYKRAFFNEKKVPVSTVRAGNVIGGGDFAADRIIPDTYKAVIKGERVKIRSPYSVRPYQHVIEPIYAYLLLAAQQTKSPECSGNYNIGPDSGNCISTINIVNKFCELWDALPPEYVKTDTPHEANYLKLDCSKIKSVLNWYPVWNIDDTIAKTVCMYKAIAKENDVKTLMLEQIKEYQTEFCREK